MTVENNKNNDAFTDNVLSMSNAQIADLVDKLVKKSGVRLVAAGSAATAAGGAASGGAAAAAAPKEVKIKSVNDTKLLTFVRGIVSISKKIGHVMSVKDGSVLLRKVSSGEVVTLDFVKPGDAAQVIKELTELGVTCA